MQYSEQQRLKEALEQLAIELGLKSVNRLFTEAGVNRTQWYKRITPGSTVTTNRKQLDSFLAGLEEMGLEVLPIQRERLYGAIGMLPSLPGPAQLAPPLVTSNMSPGLEYLFNNPRLASERILTFLFTDIEGSTRLWEKFPDLMPLVLDDLNRLLNSEIEKRAGYIFKTVGDACYAVFESPAKAVLTAVEIQSALHNAAWPGQIGEIKVRMGLHSGPPGVVQAVAGGWDFLGQSLNRVSRLMALGHGGQILLSESCAALVQGLLPTELSLKYLGEYTLKDVAQPIKVFQAGLATLPSEFPPLRDGEAALNLGKRQDWGDAPEVRNFYGREHERALLHRWMTEEKARLVGLLGLGGAGKTTLATLAGQALASQFDFVFWRSLRNAPPLEELLGEFVQLCGVTTDNSSPGLSASNSNSDGLLINRVLATLQKTRCLLILDNAESILQEGSEQIVYKPGYNGYGQLIRQIAETAHQSCLLVTSREKLPGLGQREGTNSPVRSLRLKGLDAASCHQLLLEKGITADEKASGRLAEYYAGNPLALKLVSETMLELYDGNLDYFLAEGATIFGDISQLLGQQFDRLSPTEQELMTWLAINRESVSRSELAVDLLTHLPRAELQEKLEILFRRSMIEQGEATATFTLQAVIMEFVTQRLGRQILEEIKSGKLDWLGRYIFTKAQAKDYVRVSQERQILKPLTELLLGYYRREENLVRRLLELIGQVRQLPLHEQGYAGGNLLNLLVSLRKELRNYDLSGLNLWQAYLPEVRLPGVNFSHSDLSGAVFTETFDGVMSLAFSPDDQHLALGSVNGQVRVWQVQSGQLIFQVRGHTKTVRSLAFSGDGKVLVSVSDDGQLKLWNWQSRSGNLQQSSFEAHFNRIWSVALSPDGKLLASGGEDQTVRLWEVESQRCRYVLEGHTNWVRSVAFSPDGKVVASGSGDKTVRVWEAESGKCLHILAGHSDRVRSVAFSPDGKVIASGGEDHTIRLWDTATGSFIFALEGHTDRVRSIAFGAGGQLLASGGDDQTVRLWEVASGQCRQIMAEQGGWVWAVALSSDGEIVATGGEDQAVKFWEIETGRCLKTFQGYSSWVGAVAFSPDGKWLASGAEDCTVIIWKMPGGQKLHTLTGHTGRIRTLAFSPDGITLATGGEDGSLLLWEVASGRLLRHLLRQNEWVGAVAFSPNGKQLATNDDSNNLVLLNAANGQIELTLTGHTDRVRGVAFSPDGNFIASASVDRTARLWSSLGELCHVLASHTDRVRSVAFSPDSKYVATASEDGTVKLWQTNSGECVKTFVGHEDRVWSVAFAPAEQEQGYQLASAGEDGTIRLWAYPGNEALATLQSERPYEGLNLTGATGLTEAQRASLLLLGAIQSDD